MALPPRLHLSQDNDRILLEISVSISRNEPSDDITLVADSLIQHGVLTPQALDFLKACIAVGLNVAISGPPESGKRQLLRALVSLFPPDEQVLAIQNPDEPSFQEKGITTLRANVSASKEKHIITRRYLLSLVPKMHPPRLLLDGVRGSEALPLLELLLAMDGVMFSVAADCPKDALARLENMVLLTEGASNLSTIRRILSDSLDLIIQLRRSPDGLVRIVSLTEVCRGERDAVALRDLFLDQAMEERKGKSISLLRPTGTRPQFMNRIQMLGISLPSEMFVAP